MKLLILGVSGLIGHKLYHHLSGTNHDVHGVMHGSLDRFKALDLFKVDTVRDGVDLRQIDQVFALLDELKPDVIFNCSGVTRRRPEVNDPITAIKVNSLLPHELARWAGENNSRVIQFSTDCVFDGEIGNYTEESNTTPEDAYGRTKALGEIRYDHCLTLRSSFIGQEIQVHSELLAWFLQQEGKKIRGFTNAMYSGISTTTMARVVTDIIENHEDIGGLYNLAIEKPISKYDLLLLARDAFNIDVEIEPFDDFHTNPTLNGSKLRKETGIMLPSWEDMMQELANDRGLYKSVS